ncbi:Probable transposable element [Penicillium roqueforti FM164]|uniref:Probable transposable element n=1 Tax=Penicillium roqueforti (strain FM164) TaxID=1365484 RepID=W6PRH6_PENRF|nr:Probable transposable element [Penicillium roqueforti FM164]
MGPDTIQLNSTDHVILNVFRAASDASFADNIGRKSSQGFIFTLFSGPIDWSARKQRIVTTSTTEAELVALSEAAKYLLWMKRLLHSIEFDTEHDLILSYDNKQTIDLITKSNSSYQTKLHHVHINN